MGKPLDKKELGKMAQAHGLSSRSALKLAEYSSLGPAERLLLRLDRAEELRKRGAQKAWLRELATAQLEARRLGLLNLAAQLFRAQRGL